jgi:hypothetical protein
MGSQESTSSLLDVSYQPTSSHRQLGINPKFTFPSKERKGIQSPLLIWGDSRSYMKFNYELGFEASETVITNEIACYSDLAGRLAKKRWIHRVYISQKEEKGSKCFKLINVDYYYWLQCQTFRVRTTAEIHFGTVTVSDIQFGDKSLCNSFSKLRTSLKCDFENGDCAVENDACGMVGWELREDSTRSSVFDPLLNCYKEPGVQLLKNQIRKHCSIEDLNIPELQRSGFIIASLPHKIDSMVTSTKTRKQRSSGYSLHLDPSHTTGVAFGILNLPEVQHDAANAYFTFYHDMGEGGIHDLLVTAVCTSDPDQFLVPLDSRRLHYHKTNFDATGSSGIICLDIHTYVDPNECSKFVIQMHAAAVLQTITIDNIFFASSPYCNKSNIVVTYINGCCYTCLHFRYNRQLSWLVNSCPHI